MNYQRLYHNIISNARTSQRKKSSKIYYESHHILPKSLGGSDDKDNLILLTAKEHFICHHLLTKMYPYSKELHFAFWCMIGFTSQNQSRYKCSSKTYSFARIRHAKLMSEKWKQNNPNKHRSMQGENNPMFGVSRYGKENPFYNKHHTTETKLRISEKNSKKIWSDEERKKLSDSWKDRPILQCPHCGLTSKHRSNMRRYHFDNCKVK